MEKKRSVSTGRLSHAGASPVTPAARSRPAPSSGGLEVENAAVNPELSWWAQRVLAALPIAKVTWKANRPSFDVGGKIFAFTGSRGGTVMKLPELRVHELVGSGELVVLTMGKRSMREWVVARGSLNERELELVREACAYVASLPKAK